MKRIAKEGQVIIAGRIGSINKKTDSLVTVSVANRKGKDDPEWVTVTFTNSKKEGPKLADLVLNYAQKGQYIIAVCNEVKNGEYTNLYAVAVELGPRSTKAA